MKKQWMFLAVLFLLGGQVVLADVLPPGEKEIRACAYFTNTADTLDDMAVIGFERDPGGETVDLSQFMANECFGPGYKFNDYRVFGLAIENSDVLKSPTYVPQADPNAYEANMVPIMGALSVPEYSTLESVKYAYRIVKLDKEKKQLIIEPVQTEKYFKGQSSPTILTGEVRIYGDEEDNIEQVFNDVNVDSPYAEALKYLKAEGIISGYSDGSFKPNNTINRAEFTKIISGAVATTQEINDCMAHYASQNSYMATVFSDVTFAMVGGNEPAWYFDYVCIAKLKGFVSGYADGSFRPSQNINFAEAAKIITKALGYETGTTDPWYKTYVDQLDSKKAIPLTIQSFGKNITRGEMAEMIWRLKANITDQSSAHYDDLK